MPPDLPDPADAAPRPAAEALRTDSLFNFITDRQRYIAVIGVFLALTLFVTQIPFPPLAHALSFLLLAITVLLWSELVRTFPKKSPSLNVAWFENLTNFLLLGIIAYWLVAYLDYWKVALFYVIFFFFLWLLSFFIKRHDVFNRLFKTRAGQYRVVRYICMGVVWTLAWGISVLAASPLHRWGIGTLAQFRNAVAQVQAELPPKSLPDPDIRFRVTFQTKATLPALRSPGRR